MVKNLQQAIATIAEDVEDRSRRIGTGNSTLSASNAISSSVSRRSAVWNASGS